jgi:hypothetical protein
MYHVAKWFSLLTKCSHNIVFYNVHISPCSYGHVATGLFVSQMVQFVFVNELLYSHMYSYAQYPIPHGICSRASAYQANITY